MSDTAKPPESAKRPFAVFDIDGTIIRWQLFHGIVSELGKRNLLDETSVQAIKQARMRWKTRVHPKAFDEYQNVLVDALDSSIKTISVEDFDSAVQAVFSKHREQVYTFTRDLIVSLKRKNYLLFAISGSFQQIVSEFAAFYGFDDAIGSTFYQEDGAFTGAFHIIHQQHKVTALEALVQKHNAAYVGSIAVGDTDGDAAMLAAVEQPIAFNPNRTLYEIAKERGWQIVIERKNVIYKLEARDGSYVLA